VRTGLVVLLGALLLCFLPAGVEGAPRDKAPRSKRRNPTPAPRPDRLDKQPQLDKKIEAKLAALEAEHRALLTSQRSYQAVPVLRKLLVLQRQHLAPGDQRTFMTRVQLAAILMSSGAYREAAEIYREGLAIAEKHHAKDSSEVGMALQQLAAVYWLQGRYGDADGLYRRTLPIWKKLHGETYVYAAMLSGYGAFLSAWSAYGAAERIYEEALRITEKSAASPDDQTLLSPLLTLASSYWNTGQQGRAVPLFARALTINDARPSTEVQQRASTVFSVANVYHYGGREDLARPLFERCRKIYLDEIALKEKGNPKAYEITALYTMLATMEKSLGNHDAARKALSRVIALDEKEHGSSAWYATLADVERAAGNGNLALALLDRAEQHLVKLAGPSMRSIYAVSRGEVLRDLGRYAEAEAMMRLYLQRQLKMMGERHPATGGAYLLLAGVLMQEKKAGPAEDSMEKALDIAERELSLVLSTGSEADHVVYFHRNSYVLDAAVELHREVAPASKRAAALAMTTVLRRKGRILDASAAALAALRGRLSPDDAKALEQLDEARAKLAKLIVAGPQATGAGEYTQAVADLDREVRQLEELIRKRSAAYRAISQPIELGGVQSALGTDERLVELMVYQPFGARRYDRKTLPPKRYGAYVVGRAGAPAFVDLGPAAAIDQAVELFRTAVADPDDDRVTERGRALYDLTLAKVAPLLGGATKISLAPDGQLNLVPFAALVEPSGQLVVQKYTITYLTSGRDLLRGKVSAKPRGKAVIIADPAFGAAGGAANDNAAAADPTRGRRSRDLTISSWRPLPGTRQEAEAIHGLLRGAELLRGEQATESALKAVAAPLVLHVATHGFFLPVAAPLAEEGEGSAGRGAGTAAAAPAAPAGGSLAPAVSRGGENPLLRSGLALAGANALRSGGEDGILTALEASGLDLWGTRLVVLSACETGVGKVSNGEGVYGLRRALVIAGAESLVMSLWQVDDLATRDLMMRFYKKLEGGQGRSEALRAAQLETLAKPAQRHPFYWAAFQPTGDSSPIKEWR
jgi:CHAT domain-containing protein